MRTQPSKAPRLRWLLIACVLSSSPWVSPDAAWSKPKRGAKKKKKPKAAPAAEEPATPEPDEDADAEPEDATPEPEPSADTPPEGEDQPTDAPDEAEADTPPPAESQAAPQTAPTVDPAETRRIQDQAQSLRDRLFKARARVSILGSKLFQSKLTLQLRTNLERFYNVTDLTITIDGAPVFRRDSGLPPGRDELFELFAAPGAHELGVSADLVARRDATYKLRLDQTFTVIVPEDSTVSTRLVIRETGNMWRFAKRRRGRHALSFRLRARAKANKRGGRRSRAKAGVSVSGGGK